MLSDRIIIEKLKENKITIRDYGLNFAKIAMKNGFGIDEILLDLKLLESSISLEKHQTEKFEDCDLTLSDGKVSGCGDEFYDPDVHSDLLEFQGISWGHATKFDRHEQKIQAAGDQFIRESGKGRK